MDVLRATYRWVRCPAHPKSEPWKLSTSFEPVKRGIYGGAVGYLAWNGNMDTAIAIRTAVIKDGKLFIQAGGGMCTTQSRG